MAAERYTLSYLGDFEVVVEVDRSLATDEKLAMINDFWIDGDERLADADGDLLKAVLARLCCRVLSLSMETFDVKAAFEKGQEGWPRLDGEWGITLLSYDDFQLFHSDVEVKHG
ncbi:DUF2528 family protein [Chromobacterium haemolyticum]|uniref:DUF2528 family protein n=1 Tax=Chromobacterium haemolyticum TaxID=394935 RepID=UPI000DEF3FCA|nr:DUF2528 family protein [Chromobacterium haemolyticum]